MVVSGWTHDEIVAVVIIVCSIVGLTYGLIKVLREGSKR